MAVGRTALLVWLPWLAAAQDSEWIPGDHYCGDPEACLASGPQPGPDAESAETALWAGQGGTSPYATESTHADDATTSPVANDADLADDAVWADDGGTADDADVALDVAECAGGPWLDDGSCGALVASGPVGLGTDPTATLDVSGQTRVGPIDILWSSVRIGGIEDYGASSTLRVAETIQADGFEATAKSIRHIGVPRSQCVETQQGSLLCPVAAPTGSDLFALECLGTTLSVEWSFRDLEEGQVEPMFVMTGAGTAAIPAWTVGDAEAHYLHVEGQLDEFLGCRFWGRR